METRIQRRSRLYFQEIPPLLSRAPPALRHDIKSGTKLAQSVTEIRVPFAFYNAERPLEAPDWAPADSGSHSQTPRALHPGERSRGLQGASVSEFADL